MSDSVNGKFISLHNHTELGSPLDGMNKVDELFKRAKEIDHPGIAVTDHGTLTALYDSWKESKKTGVKLIPGGEFYFSDDMSTNKTNHLILLAKNANGYKNLLRLNYESFKNQAAGFMGKKTPRITWEHIESFNKDLICLTACSNGLIAKTLITDENEELACQYIDRFNSIFKDNFYLEIQPHSLYAVGKTGRVVNQVKLNESLIRISHDKDIPYVITCDAHYKDKDHAKYHDFMLAIKDKKPINDPDRFRYGVQDMYLKTHEEIEDFFGKDIATKGMQTSIDIMNRCDTAIYLGEHEAILPKFPVKEEKKYSQFIEWKNKTKSNIDEDKAYLRYLCLEAFKKKFGDRSSEEKKSLWDRVKYELSILEKRDFSSYMLIVADYINWAKSTGMPVGPGRGSAAGSLVAYLIGITNVDPIKYDLLFERFHNAEKTSFPDIDTDFANPGLVKDYLQSKYGSDKVASISNMTRLSPKVVVKDSARSLLLGGSTSSAFQIANKMTDFVPDNAKTIESVIDASDDFRREIRKYPELLEYGSKLQGLTKNFSVHAAGVVIADEPLYELVPLRIEDKTGITATQWEKKRVEAFGLVKMDLLGLNTLNIIEECLNIIHERTGKKILMEDIPLDDLDTYKNIMWKGNTAGIFQLESTLSPLCVALRPRDVEGISAINALGRPSCSQATRDLYIARENKLAKVEFYHPSLKRALQKTNGILLYEESAMFIAQDCAGWDLNQADSLRKLSKLKGSDPALALKTESNFIKDCMKHINVSYETASHIWTEYVETLSGYAFNHSHAVAYSIISVYTAWLKHNYPTEFMCALLNGQDPNDSKSQTYLDECKKMGINILPPDIVRSAKNYRVVSDNEIVTGLTAIKGVGESAIDNIIESRPYSNLAQFFAFTEARVVNKRVLESLAKVGAFNIFNRTRKDVFDNYVKYRTRLNTALLKYKKKNELEDISKELLREPELLELINSEDVIITDEEFDRKQILIDEKEVLGRSISGSYHEVFDNFFRQSGVTFLDQIANCAVNSKVKIEVVVNSKKKEFTVKKEGANLGRKFAKYAIEDIKGNIGEVTLWMDDYEKYRDTLVDGTPIKAICKVGEYKGTKDISLVQLERISGVKK